MMAATAGIGRTEPAVFRPSTAQWFVLGPNGSRMAGTFGATNLHDIPVPGDYYGVGHAELAIFRPSTAQWIVQSPSGSRVIATYGATSLFDYPAVTSVGSLKKLGAVGGIKIASLNVSVPFRSGAELVAPPDTVTSETILTTKPAKPAAAQPSHHEAVLKAALESLLNERVRRGR